MKSGTGALEFARSGPRTVVRRAFATSPLKLLNPRSHGRAAWVYLSTYGGGLVGGDALRIDLDVGPGASALLTTQASTKIYRSPAGASQQLTAHISDDAVLVVAPDPVVCFAGSSYRQEQSFELDAGASLVAVDWLTSGRHAAGERWAFDEYWSRLTVSRGGRLAFYDALSLAAGDQSVVDRVGRFNVLLLALLVGPAVRQRAGDLVARIGRLPVGSAADLVVAAAPIGADGAILRAAGVSMEDVLQLVRAEIGFLWPLLGDDPWIRKGEPCT